MKAKLTKIHKGIEATSIEKSFTDPVELRSFLASQGFNITAADALHDVQQAEVKYVAPLLDVEAGHGYN